MGHLFRLYLGIAVVSMLVAGVLGWFLSKGTPSALPVAEPAVPAFGAAEIVYFYEPGCPVCQQTGPFLDRLEQRYSQYRWARVDISYPRGMELAEQYYEHHRVPERDRGLVPVLFAGERAFRGYPAIRKELPAYLSRAALSRRPPRVAAEDASSRAAAAGAIRGRFASFRVAPVLVAGLVDSINPCAIATLIFFLSYLAFAGRKPRELLGVGAAFTAGVFLTYLLIGFGLLRLLHTLPVTTMLGRWVYPLTGLATLILAGISFGDFLKARRGKTAAIALQMPRRLKLWAHRVIRTGMRPDAAPSAGRLAAAAFATAVLVSALEFTCTSQVYLPTLVYMVQVEGHRLRAAGLLVLYNLMFVTPLIVLFVLSYLGVSSRALGAFFTHKVAATKLAMAILFTGFSVYMFAIAARVL